MPVGFGVASVVAGLKRDGATVEAGTDMPSGFVAFDPASPPNIPPDGAAEEVPGAAAAAGFEPPNKPPAAGA